MWLKVGRETYSEGAKLLKLKAEKGKIMPLLQKWQVED